VGDTGERGENRGLEGKRRAELASCRGRGRTGGAHIDPRAPMEVSGTMAVTVARSHEGRG